MFITNVFQLTKLSKLIISFILFFLIAFSNIYSQENNKQIFEKANSIYQKVDRMKINFRHSVPSIVRGILDNNIDLKNKINVKNFFQVSAEIFKYDNKTDNFKTKKIFTDKSGMTHLKLQQEYKGIPVWGSELILHSNSTRQLKEINGRFIPNLNIDITPAITSDQALEVALSDLGDAEYRWLNLEQENILKEVFNDVSRSWKPIPELMIAPLRGDYEKGEYKLVWQMTIAVIGEKLGNYEYFINAKNGEIINKYNSMPDVTGTGDSNYNGTVSFETYYNSSNQNYELYDNTRNIKTYTANNTSTSPGTLLTDTDNTWTHENGVDAHWGMQKVYDFWDIVFGRDSYDDNGSMIINTVNYLFSDGSNNAKSAGGGQFYFGAGDGTTFSSVTSLDVVGHEFNHAINDSEANLEYQGESGAIDESLADIMGTVIEFYSTPSTADWLIGEDCYTPNTSGDALRSMSNPNSEGQPDTYNGTNWASTTSDYDFGGVHTNSGVLNFAFYLMCQGGSGTNDNGTYFTVTGIGIVKGRAIVQRVHTIYLISSSNYASAREAFLSAATDLYGSSSTEYNTVSDAFGAVGIGIVYFAKNSFNAGTIKMALCGI